MLQQAIEAKRKKGFLGRKLNKGFSAEQKALTYASWRDNILKQVLANLETPAAIKFLDLYLGTYGTDALVTAVRLLATEGKIAVGLGNKAEAKIKQLAGQHKFRGYEGQPGVCSFGGT